MYPKTFEEICVGVFSLDVKTFEICQKLSRFLKTIISKVFEPHCTKFSQRTLLTKEQNNKAIFHCIFRAPRLYRELLFVHKQLSAYKSFGLNHWYSTLYLDRCFQSKNVLTSLLIVFLFFFSRPIDLAKFRSKVSC